MSSGAYFHFAFSNRHIAASTACIEHRNPSPLVQLNLTSASQL